MVPEECEAVMARKPKSKQQAEHEAESSRLPKETQGRAKEK